MNIPTRRLFLGSLGIAFVATQGLFAEHLAATPAVTEGPFYPDRLPLDTDNDLLIIGNSITPAVGEVTRLSGRILDAGGRPINDATVEIWQVDHSGVYINSRSPGKDRQDKNFQGYGRFSTASDGRYTFRTIKPVPYDGRCPHIHVKVSKGGRELLTTQIFVEGHPMNARDGVLSGVRDPLDRELLIAPFIPVSGSKIGELAVNFPIVIGRTPERG